MVGVGAAGVERRGTEGGMTVDDCCYHETFSKNKNVSGNCKRRIYITPRLIGTCKMLNFLQLKGIKACFVETITSLWRLLPSSRAQISCTLLSYKNLIREGKQI